MNTNLKVGDRVKIISGANMLEHNNQCGVIQQIGEPTMPLFTDYMAIKLDSGIVALCYTYEDDNRVVNIKLLEAAKPTPKWLPIDKDNLPVDRVAAIEIKNPNLLFTGTLYVDDDFGISLEMYKGATVHGFTHYIPLSDLLNLPIAE